eukprot:GFYU01002440.1.p1 GENE.GFYU01002440.1~~GFYU01002440.1.p1  ORF type:complete len:480 (-),score=160.37 GFYU01002440.1:238-1677(-)
MAVNWWLIIVAIVMTALVFIANLYILAYYQDPDDYNVAIWPKIVVVFSLTTIMLSVLVLPFDVANRGSGNSLDTKLLWEFVFMIASILLIFVIPFSLFFYESDDESPRKQFMGAVKWMIGFFLVFGLIFGLMYGLIGFTEIDYVVLKPDAFYTPAAALPAACQTCTREDRHVSFRVTFPVYLVAFLSFVGWFFFVLFGGIGFVALPMDLINSWRNRPSFMDVGEYAKQKVLLRDRAQKLIEIGKRIEEEGRHLKKNRANKKLYNKFKQAVYFLEKDYDTVKAAYRPGETAGMIKFWKWFQLFLGLLALGLSVMWIVHIILFMFTDPPSDPFLNTMFNDLDASFPFLGVVFYGLFAFYLLWVIISGCFKFGVRFFWFQIHPMKVGGTMMNSFLFNCALIMICTLSVVHFCTDAFNLYTRLTAMDMFFGTQIRNLKFFKYFWSFGVFSYTLFSISGISLIYFAMNPRDKSKEDELAEKNSR